MDIVLRSIGFYLVLLLFLRITGKRALAQVTSFDFVLLLIIAEAVQQGLVGEDYSMTTALLAVLTLVTLDILLSIAKRRSRRLESWVESRPLVLVENGRVNEERMQWSRVDVDDILESARELRGLWRLDQIRYAVLERDGVISIIPKESPPSPPAARAQAS
jgi:uncharacterized membrane protein YcaP (DUF421 family)